MRENICRSCVNIRNGVKTKISIPHTCGKSEEEIQRDIERSNAYEKRFKSTLTALKIIGEIKENTGKIICPHCGGDLRYARQSNGHVWGKCKTEGCLSWVQ